MIFGLLRSGIKFEEGNIFCLMIDSTGFAVYDLNVNRVIVDKSTDAERLIRRGKAILQTASEHIRQLK